MNKLDIVEIAVGNNDFIAADDIEAGEKVLFVPEEMLLTVSRAKESSEFYKLYMELSLEPMKTVFKGKTVQEIFKLGEHRKDREKPQLASILLLMEERNKPDSYWKDYIGTLPKDFSNWPPFFSQDELSLFEGSFTQQSYDREIANYSKWYREIVGYIPTFGAMYTVEDFL